jgi:hypothetical protein
MALQSLLPKRDASAAVRSRTFGSDCTVHWKQFDPLVLGSNSGIDVTQTLDFAAVQQTLQGNHHSPKTSWSIRKLRMVLVVKKTHISHPSKIFN